MRLTYFFVPDKNHFFLENKILESHHSVSLSKKLVRIGYHILRFTTILETKDFLKISISNIRCDDYFKDLSTQIGVKGFVINLV